VGRCVCKREVGGGLRAERHKNERGSLVLGAPCETVVDCDGGRWWCGADEVVVVVGCCVRKREAEEGLGAKNHEMNTIARFRVRRAKRWRRTMVGGGDVVQVSWWWWWGCAFANTRWESGLGAKKHET
jgi:hypothetical protein